MKVQEILMVALVLAAVRAEAAVTITPASPTSQDSITAVIDVSAGCFDTLNTSVVGNSIRTDIVRQNCFPVPIPFTVPESVRFGPLAPGTYTYDVYLNYVDEHTGPVLDSHHTIVVAPAIPAIDDIGLSILAIALAGAACFALAKR